jgi:hypothetical protein
MRNRNLFSKNLSRLMSQLSGPARHISDDRSEQKIVMEPRPNPFAAAAAPKQIAKGERK